MPLQHDRDVLKALREGKRLCGNCLGHKRVYVITAGDFYGDPPRAVIWACEACSGTGLENGVG